MIDQLRNAVGHKNVLTGTNRTAYFRSGFRSGKGGAAAVVFPKTLKQFWETLKVCVKAQSAIIIQAAKTGLTEGSCPSGSEYGRDVVIINVTGIKKIILLDDGKQAIVFPGTTLHELTQVLQTVGRTPHSVIGSTSIGATVIGGIANNSGGALCKLGSAYTELALFAKVDAQGELHLIDHLSINGLGDTPEDIFATLESGNVSSWDVQGDDRLASDREYKERIRDLDATIPNRYNADPSRLFEVSGSGGKVAAFAVRVDTYPAPKKKKVFYLGTNDRDRLVALRRDVLEDFDELPDMCEYLSQSVFDTASRYGKDVFLSIKYLGTKNLPRAYALKSAVEYRLNKIPFLPKYLPDQFLYFLSRFFPNHLPKRLLNFRDKFEHHLIISTSDDGIDEMAHYLESWRDQGDGEYFECTEQEQSAALLHRFAAAGAAIRYQTLHQRTTEEVLALDIALLGNDSQWLEDLPPEVTKHLELELYYGHYICHVFHQDLIFKKGTDIEAIKMQILHRLDEKGAKYPAEHNVGHMYQAEDDLRRFYEELDPTNTFNPGIGKTSKGPRLRLT